MPNEIEESRKDLLAGIRVEAEKEFLSSPFFQGTKWLLGLVVVLGIGLWGYGAHVAQTKIDSVQETARRATSEIAGASKAAIEEMERTTEDVRRQASEIIERKILGDIGSRVEVFNTEADKAADLIQAKKLEALAILETVAVEDIRAVNEQLAQEIEEAISLKAARQKQLDEVEAVAVGIGRLTSNRRLLWTALVLGALSLIVAVVAVVKSWCSAEPMGQANGYAGP